MLDVFEEDHDELIPGLLIRLIDQDSQSLFYFVMRIRIVSLQHDQSLEDG